MSVWKVVKAKRLRSALERAGWAEARVSGSHRTFKKAGAAPIRFAFHDSEEVGPKMVARIAKQAGLKPDDLWQALHLRSACVTAALLTPIAPASSALVL